MEEIEEVTVFEGDCVAAVEACSGEDGVVEEVDELGVVIKQGAKCGAEVAIDLGCVECHATWNVLVEVRTGHKSKHTGLKPDDAADAFAAKEHSNEAADEAAV
jgi:hypothetical protein